MAIALFIIYVFLIFAAAGFARFQTSNVDDAIKLFAIYGAALSGFFTAIISYINISRQANISIRLEQIKAELVTDIEGVKIRLYNTNDAYTKLIQAMRAFYNTLDVEKGIYSKTESKNADDLLSNSSYLLERLAPECKNSFIGFYQKLRFLRESFDKKISNDKRVLLWSEEKKNIAQLWNEFNESVKEHHPEVANPS